MLVCGDIVYAQTWQVLYRATFICQYGLFCCMALVSFRLFCKNLGNLQEFLGTWITAPPGKKLPVRLCAFRIMDFGFQPLLVEIGFWIPFVRGFWIPWAELWIPKTRINSGFHKHNFHGFQISEFGFLSMGRSLEEVPLMAPLPSVNLSVNDCKLLH